jgi:hypothetical protein
MEINFNQIYSAQNPISKPNARLSFEGARSKKLIAKIKNATQLKKIAITFDELVNAYKEIGYDVFFKRGSHAVVPITDNCNIPLVIPHDDKYVSPYDLKRFRHVLNGEFEKAIRV